MSDNENRNTLDERIDDAFSAYEDAATPAPAKAGGVTAGLAMLLALIAIGAASYAVYVTQFGDAADPVVEDTALRGELEALQQQLREQSRTSETRLTEALATQLAGHQELLDAQTANSEARLAAALEDIANSAPATTDDWVAAEVEYLVRLANQRVLVEREPATALQLLRAADDILASREGLTAHALRQALAFDIAALETVADVDHQGIYLRLSGLKRQVPALKTPQPVFVATELPELEFAAEATLLQRLGALLRRAGDRLLSLVDYRRGVERINPVLPPDQEYYLRQNLILKLQIAQIALLNEEQAVYETSLSESAEWLAQHFVADDALTQRFGESLRTLGEVTVAQQLPDIGGSLREARSMVRGAGGGVQ